MASPRKTKHRALDFMREQKAVSLQLDLLQKCELTAANAETPRKIIKNLCISVSLR
jgi:hypothetical protein